MKTIAQPLVSKCSECGVDKHIFILHSHSLGRQQPFILGVYSDNNAPIDFPGQTGFNMDYVQVNNCLLQNILGNKIFTVSSASMLAPRDR